MTDQTRRLVYVVGQDGKTAVRNVETGPLVEGLRVVRTGLGPRDRVVLDGLTRLQPGTPVQVRMTRITPRAANDAPVSTPITAPARGGSDGEVAAAMRFPHFFIDRPIFACGAVDPDRDRRRDRLSDAARRAISRDRAADRGRLGDYPGASAETLAQTVAAPLEESINGVEDMIYMSSSSTGDGTVAITVTFAQGSGRRSGAGAGPEPGRDRRAAPAGAGAPDRRDGAQELARPADGRDADFARRIAAAAISVQLRDAAAARPPQPRAGRRQRAAVRRARL